MSIPSVFTPVKIDGHLLVDGGVVRNLTAQDVRDLGADVVIGGDVGAPLYKEEDLKSFLNIVDQITSFQKAAVNEEQQKLCDYLLIPEIGSYGSSDFKKAAFFIRQGEAVARKMLPRLKLLADSLKLLASLPPPIPEPQFPDSIVIAKIEIDGLDPVAERIVKSELHIFPPERIAVADLEIAIDRLYSTQLFSWVTYRLTNSNSGKKLTVKVEEKNAHLFRIGFRYDSRNDAAILLNTTFQNFGKFGSFLAMDLKLGVDPMFDAQYFLRTADRSQLGFRGRFNYLRSSFTAAFWKLVI